MIPLEINVKFPAQTIERLAEEAARLAMRKYAAALIAAHGVILAAETSPVAIKEIDPVLQETLDRLKAELTKLQSPT